MMDIKTIFGDRRTAIVELDLTKLATIVRAAKLSEACDNPYVDLIVNEFQGALFDNEFTEIQSLSCWLTEIDNIKHLDDLKNFININFKPYIDNIDKLNSLCWEDAAYARGCKTIAGILRHAARKYDDLLETYCPVENCEECQTNS